MQIIVIVPAAFIHEKAEWYSPRLFTRGADPKKRFAALIDLNQTLFEHTRLDHEIKHLQLELGR
jgi:hypothetical protein